MAPVQITADGGEQFERLTRNLEDTLKNFNRIVARKVVPPVERYADRLVNSKLRKYPPMRKPGNFIWSLDPEKQAKARRWWYANKRGRHVRTGAMGRAWEFQIQFSINGLAILTLRNDSKGASYVYGYKPQGYAQVPTHAQTGWQNIGVVGREIMDMTTKEYDRQAGVVLDEELRVA